ncbi:MAG TPA: isocitrate lyase/PEP mutase family protein [Candidatus Binatia bacterium]|nr:isocitrate lyase/PEP mutase family protein [Candidatus Binatia bacterium]
MPKRTIAELLRSEAPVVMPGVWDALSARIAAEAGFPVVFLSGYCLSAARLGEPDIGLLTQTEVLDAAARVCAAVDVAVVVDADTGYGNAFNVERTVHELVRMGARGCFLEDQVWPKRCGHMEGKRVVPLEEYLPKLRAALAARGDAPLHVTARTDALAAVGLDEALRRARAFADAGADAVFVEAPRSPDDMAAIRATVPAGVRLVANMVEDGKTPLRRVADLQAAGFDLIVFPLTGLLAAAGALRDAYAALRRDESGPALEGRRLRFGELNALLGLDERYRREREWLR